MSKVVFDMSMSVDGYVTAANQAREEPLGEGGTRLHEWAWDATGQDVLASGLEALAQARETAAGKTVCVMGGPAVGNQYLRAGLVDELSIHLAPVLFGDGTRLSEVLPAHIRLEPIEHIPSASAMHLRYEVVRPS